MWARSIRPWRMEWHFPPDRTDLVACCFPLPNEDWDPSYLKRYPRTDFRKLCRRCLCVFHRTFETAKQLVYMARKILRAYFNVHMQGSSHLALFLTHRREKRYFLSCCFSNQSHFWTSIKTLLARKYVDPNYFIHKRTTMHCYWVY